MTYCLDTTNDFMPRHTTIHYSANVTTDYLTPRRETHRLGTYPTRDAVIAAASKRFGNRSADLLDIFPVEV